MLFILKSLVRGIMNMLNLDQESPLGSWKIVTWPWSPNGWYSEVLKSHEVFRMKLGTKKTTTWLVIFEYVAYG